MLHLTLILCDTILIATRDIPVGGMWSIVCTDALSGKIEHSSWSDEQLAAIVSLGIGSDMLPNATELYAIAETAIKGWQPEVRPIP